MTKQQRLIGYGIGLPALALLLYLFIHLIGGKSYTGDVTEDDMTLRLKEGQELAFSFARTGMVKLDMVSLLPPQGERSGAKPPPTGTFTDMKVNEQGRLLLKVYPATTGHWDVSGVITDFKSPVSTPGAEDRIQPCPFTFTISAKGSMANFRFGPAVSEPERLRILSILYELQFIFPMKPAREWQTRQRDTIGDYIAEYRITDKNPSRRLLRISKSIISYENNEIAATNFSPVAAAARVKVIRDHSDAELLADTNWIGNLRHEHSSRITSKEKLIGETNVVFTAQRLPLSQSGALPAAMNGLRELMASCSEKVIREKATATDPQLNAMAGTADLNGALQLFLNKMTSSDYQDQKLAERFMTNYLRRHPSAAAGLVAYLNNRDANKLDSNKELVLWNVLALAGTREAQQVMVGALSNTGMNMRTRASAASHLFNIEYPEPFMVQELLRLQKVNPGNSGEAQLQSTALFAVGAMAANPRISDAMRSSIVTELSARLKQAEGADEKSRALLAIGNARQPELINDLHPYLRDPDQNLRATAYQSLSKVKADNVMELMQSGYHDESSTFVKTKLLEAVGSMSDTEKASAFIRNEARTEQNNALLLPMASYLTRNAGDNEANLRALNSIIEKKPSGQVLREIYRFVSPDKLKELKERK